MRLASIAAPLGLAACLGWSGSAGAEPPAGEERPAAPRTEALPKNAVHVELAGPGLLYSVNYERFLLPKLSLRAGASLFGLRERTTGESLGVLTVPITAQYLLGRGAHHLELGLGLMTGVMWSGLNRPQGTEAFGLIAGTATVGYRYQPPRRGVMVRVAFTPVYGGERFAPLGLPFQPWGAIGVGFGF